jgi:hypothetical protein
MAFAGRMESTASRAQKSTIDSFSATVSTKGVSASQKAARRVRPLRRGILPNRPERAAKGNETQQITPE